MPVIGSAAPVGFGPRFVEPTLAGTGGDPLITGIRLRFCYISRVIRDLYNKIERWAGRRWAAGQAGRRAGGAADGLVAELAGLAAAGPAGPASGGLDGGTGREVRRSGPDC
jgi:hypothetical protein